MDLTRLNMAQRISGVAILVVAVAAFLPWVSLFGISKLGIEGDGVLTLLAAALGGLLLARSSGLLRTKKPKRKGSEIAQVVLAGLTALIGLIDMNGAAALGLYLTLFAGVAWVVGASWQLSISKRETAAATVPASETP